MVLGLLRLFACIILLVTSGCCPPNYHLLPSEPHPLPSFEVPERVRVALVLGSGGIRGMAHIGVLEELEEAGIPIDVIIGCSAGSIVGALYADNPCCEEIKETVWNIQTDSLVSFNWIYCRYGLSHGTAVHDILGACLNAQTFEELQIPLVVVASDLHTGELVPIGGGDIKSAVQASCSIPFLFMPCRHLGRVLIDGGVSSPVPVKIAHDLGAEVVIAVDLCELLSPTTPANLFEVAKRSAEIAFMWQNEGCTNCADIIIRPKTRGVGAFNDKLKGDLYLAGKKATQEILPKIRALLASQPIREDTSLINKRLISLPTYAPKICHVE